jgi:hypothetical protein
METMSATAMDIVTAAIVVAKNHHTPSMNAHTTHAPLPIALIIQERHDTPVICGYLTAATICGTRHPVVTNRPAIATAVGDTAAAITNALPMKTPSMTSCRHARRSATTDSTPSASMVFTTTIPHWAETAAQTTHMLPDAA